MEIWLISQLNSDMQPEILLVITKNVRGYHHKSAKSCFDQEYKKLGQSIFILVPWKPTLLGKYEVFLVYKD